MSATTESEPTEYPESWRPKWMRADPNGTDEYTLGVLASMTDAEYTAFTGKARGQ